MKIRAIAVCLLFAGTCSARDHDYQQGTVIGVDSSSCFEKDRAAAGSCQQYILQSDRMLFRIRPKSDKPLTGVSIGETAEFRIGKEKLIVRFPQAGGKEKDFLVLSFSPRPDAATDAWLKAREATQSASK